MYYLCRNFIRQTLKDILRVEQLVARRAHNPEVAGSSPAPATKTSKFFRGFFYFLKKICI